MNLFSNLMGQQTLLPIIQADSVEQGVAIARAMSNAGIHLVEVVLRTEASLDVIKAIKKEIPELKVCRELGINIVDGLGKKIRSSSKLTGIKKQ